ncbi:MAG: HAD-IA family hydrolase [Bryobacteraceae bacterium]
MQLDKTEIEAATKVFHARAILFDMDGTHVDSSAVIDRAWLWWSARHGIPPEPILRVQQGRPNREVLREFGPHLDIEAEAAAFLRFEETDTGGVVPVPGALEAVGQARQGLWGVVTSADRSLAEVRLKATGFPVPPVLVSADMIHRGKPDPECFLLAARLLNVDPAECVVFEDAKAGAAAGKAAGMTVIGLLTSLSKGELPADWHIRDFRDVRISRLPKTFEIIAGDPFCPPGSLPPLA